MLDLVMKGMYGREVRSKSAELDADVRVVVVSADVQTSSREMVQAAGASGFLNKPAAAEELLTMMSRTFAGESSWS